MDVIDRSDLDKIRDHLEAWAESQGGDRELVEEVMKAKATLEALMSWADDAQEELYELKALVEQRGWRKGQAEALAALMARWPGKGA